MEVTVNVFAENIKSGKTILTNKAFITFVALDDAGNLCQCHLLYLKLKKRRLIFQAEVRRQERLKKKSIEENNGLTHNSVLLLD